MPCRCFRFFPPRLSLPPPPLPLQSQDPQIRDIASSSNSFENLKLSKLFDEDAISRIRWSCDWDEKIPNMFDTDLIPQIRESCADCKMEGRVCGLLGDENRGWKNQTNIFDFFRLRFSSTKFPPSQSQDPRICDIASSTNSFENLKFSNCLTKTQYRKFEGPAIVMGKFPKMFDKDSISRIRGSSEDCNGGGVCWWLCNENCSQKNRTDILVFFRPRFLSPNFSNRNCRILEFAILCLGGKLGTLLISRLQISECLLLKALWSPFSSNFNFGKVK